MDKTTPVVTKLGSRKIQKGTSTHVLNIPNIAIDNLGWKPHDKLDISIVDNEYIIIKKVE